jgi:hypothetical protein
MDRLIDADKLKEAIEKHKGTVNSTDLFKYCFDGGVDKSLFEIESAETVEAIPIDWIEAEIKRLRAMDFEFATMTAGMIEAMLKRWKEEQE